MSALILVASACADEAIYSSGDAVQSKTHLIIDTDMGGDVDDVGALAVAHYYVDQGQAEILAVIASIDERGGWAPAASDAINTYYGRPDIALAINKGPAVSYAGDSSNFTQHIGANTELYGHDLSLDSDVEDAVDLYRRLLNSQPDQSVSLVVVGWMSNIANLMLTGPNHNGDDIAKSGTQLLEAKVKQMVVMGGQYPSGSEFNFELDGPSAATVTRDLNVPMIFTGYELGTKVLSGGSLVNTPADNPVREAYRLYGKGVEPYSRASWDLSAVLYAVEGLSDYFNLSELGKNQVAYDGSNLWLGGDLKGDYYLELKDADAESRLEERLNTILESPPSASQ